MNDDELIDALGGATALAKRLGSISSQGVSNWKTRGIPAQWRPKMLAVARAAGVQLDEEAFLRVPALEPENVSEHEASSSSDADNVAKLPDGLNQSSRSSLGGLSRGGCADASGVPAEPAPWGGSGPSRDLSRGEVGEFHAIEPPTLKQAVFETGLVEALAQPTEAERFDALDRLQAQVRRRVA